MDAVYALGRIAVVVIFLVLGVSEMANIEATAGQIRSMVLDKLPWPVPVAPTMIAVAVVALQVIAALLVIFGYWTRTAAFVLLVGTIGYFVFANDLWTVDAFLKMINQSQALHLSLIGALLMLTAAGAGGWSVDGRRPHHIA
jgi:putative oxidoreductase